MLIRKRPSQDHGLDGTAVPICDLIGKLNNQERSFAALIGQGQNDLMSDAEREHDLSNVFLGQERSLRVGNLLERERFGHHGCDAFTLNVFN